MGSRLAAIGVCATFSAGALAGCGGGSGIASKSPDAILSAASDAIAHASSVHVSGALVTGGVPLDLDLSLVAGKGGRGQMQVGGLSFRLITVGQTVYINGTPAFWRRYGGAAAAPLLDGKWLKAPAAGQYASIAQLTNMQRLTRSLLVSRGSVSKGPTTTVNGQHVVALTDKATGETLYVATSGPPYPVELKRSGTRSVLITFDRFNQPVTLTPPTNAVTPTQLG